MQVVILCGGRGKRAYPLTDDLPKPMLPVAGVPILVHLMQLFADQGHTEFVLAAGYRQDVIRDHFGNATPEGWQVQIVDTGEDVDTGERVSRCRHLLRDVFMVTYGDGLSDVPINQLLSYHAAHNGLATVTTAPLACQFGTVEMDSAGRITSFREKPVLREHWINAGFMVMDTAIFQQWTGTSLERHVLPALTARGLVYAYRHEGFFKPLDSPKDQDELDAMVHAGPMPWRRASRS